MEYESKYNELVEAVRAVVENNSGLCNIDERLSRLSKLLPEKESEDERIRKMLVEQMERWKKCAEDNNVEQDVKDASAALAYLEKQKEQKPNVELIQKSWYLEGYHDGKYNNEPKWLIQTGKGGPRYEENPRYGTQKPAEWSEEDKTMLERCISKMANIIPVPDKHGLTNISFEKHTDEKLAAWLKSLPERFNLPPKQEWSKEEMGILLECISVLQNSSHWLLADRLSSLRPQPHWKPSKEQIDALNSIILTGSFTYVGQTQDLISLKDELKKL